MKYNNNFDDFPAIGGVMATKMVVKEKKKVLFMYREKPSFQQDSGWRIFSGHEDQDYVDNPDNTGIYNPSTILKIDPSIAELLLNPVGFVFERENEDSDWYEVDDFEFEMDYPIEDRITDDWSIEISNLFLRHKDESGDLIYTMKGKTVRLAVWLDKGKTRQELYEQHKNWWNENELRRESTIDSLEFHSQNVSSIGFVTQESDGQKGYKVLNGYSLADGQIVQSAIYFDEDSDSEWASGLLKSVNFGK